MTDPNNGAPAPQYPASNGTPDANNPAEPNTAAPQYGAPAPAYGQLSGNPYGQPAYGQEQPTQPNPAYSQPYGQPAGAQSAPAYGQPAYGQPNGNPYGQPDGAYGQVPPTYNAYPAPAAATGTNAVPAEQALLRVLLPGGIPAFLEEVRGVQGPRIPQRILVVDAGQLCHSSRAGKPRGCLQ